MAPSRDRQKREGWQRSICSLGQGHRNKPQRELDSYAQQFWHLGNTGVPESSSAHLSFSLTSNGSTTQLVSFLLNEEWSGCHRSPPCIPRSPPAPPPHYPFLFFLLLFPFWNVHGLGFFFLKRTCCNSHRHMEVWMNNGGCTFLSPSQETVCILRGFSHNPNPKEGS